MAQTITIPTELSLALKRDRIAMVIFRRLSMRAKLTYAEYVISASKSKERIMRSRDIVMVLAGKRSQLPNPSG